MQWRQSYFKYGIYFNTLTLAHSELILILSFLPCITRKASLQIPIKAPWCSGYHYCKTSFNKVWTLVQHSFISSTKCRRWECLTMVPPGKRLNAVRRLHTSQKQLIIININIIIIITGHCASEPISCHWSLYYTP